ncbi:MAG: response regulator [Alphaproteobacteria bacterium]|nr:response regulator [Alphaproteobacteria bacterium]
MALQLPDGNGTLATLNGLERSCWKRYSVEEGPKLGSATPAPRSALVVEDEWLVRMELADALTDAGWNVVEAPTGEAALEYLGQGRQFHLLVTDIRLPGPVDGWTVAERYRAADPHIVVIYCSGNPINNERQVENSTFLPKPCRIDVLLDVSNRASGDSLN